MSNTPEIAVVAKGVGVKYDLRLSRRTTTKRLISDLRQSRSNGRARAFWALDGVTFTLRRGDVLGVMGRNGSGKSTLLMTIAGILQPDRGEISWNGRMRTTLLALGAGFESTLTGRENVFLAGALLGISRDEMARQLDSIVEFSELGDFIDVPVVQYSSGMKTRLGFAIATQVKPDLLLLDEVLGVGDPGFQERSRLRLREVMHDASAIVLVSQNTTMITETCTKAIWLQNGRAAEMGDPDEVVRRYTEFIRRQRGPVRAIA